MIKLRSFPASESPQYEEGVFDRSHELPQVKWLPQSRRRPPFFSLVVKEFQKFTFFRRRGERIPPARRRRAFPFQVGGDVCARVPEFLVE